MTEMKLSDVQLKAAKDAFKQFDKKEEGQIRVNDLEKAMTAAGQKAHGDWLETIEEDIDSEATGFIKEDEFLEILRKKIQYDEDEREMKEIFRVLDKEKRGEVNVNELRWILKSLSDDLTEEDIDDMIADVDTDGSGWVDYNEFYKLMMG